MTVYASTPSFAQRRPHPKTLILIIAGHAAVLAAVMAAKTDVARHIFDPPTDVIFVPNPPPPEPLPPPPPTQDHPVTKPIVSRPIVDIPTIRPDDPIDTVTRDDPVVPPFIEPLPAAKQPIVESVRTGPRFATPPSQLKPPYPDSKRRLEEEAVLKLRLSIDARGRVTAVEPVGAADPVFLEAARRHLLAHWRYKPATEDGRGIASSTVITLRFELDD